MIPGNLGLKDALLALKWINENVGFFRGDNTSITLNGVSAGGVAVSHFIASPAASGKDLRRFSGVVLTDTHFYCNCFAQACFIV